MSAPTTEVRIKGGYDVRVNRGADIEVVVPISPADDPWVHLFNAAAAASEASSNRTIVATPYDVTVIALPAGVEAAPDWVKSVEAGLNWVTDTIGSTNRARTRLEEQAQEYAAEVQQWWTAQNLP